MDDLPQQPTSGPHAPQGGADHVRPMPVRPTARESEPRGGRPHGPRRNGPPPARSGPRAADERRAEPRREELPPPPTAAQPNLSEVRFSVDGTEWVARVAGRSAAGRGTGGAAPLLLVTLARGDAPDEPELEVLTVGRGLAGLGEPELAELLGRARPFARGTPRRQPLFSETRVGKKGLDS